MVERSHPQILHVLDWLGAKHTVSWLTVTLAFARMPFAKFFWHLFEGVKMRLPPKECLILSKVC